MDGAALFSSLRRDFLGLDTRYPLADGRESRRHYLDSAATTLMMGPAQRTQQAFLRHYANTHSDLHYSARIATDCYRWARRQVLAFVGADPGRHSCIFGGNGATAMINRLAGSLAALRPERDVVLVSGMEHHSNDLPHRRHAGLFRHIPLLGEGAAMAALDLHALEDLLREYAGRVNYVAVSGASNVTGILNPLADIARLAHAHGAWLLVDASQLFAHAPMRLARPGEAELEADFIAFSGHKVYAPGAPGGVVGRRDLLERIEAPELGGGMVAEVYDEGFEAATELTERLEAGTPNIPGAILLGAALASLDRIGMDTVTAHEQGLLRQAIGEMRAMAGVRLYGDIDLDKVPRVGIITFNLDGLDHGLSAAVLNDYHNVAVRNECFCAHPYVKEMLKAELWNLDIDPDTPAGQAEIRRRRGMVRASLGLYSTGEDIDALITGIRDLLDNADAYRRRYRPDARGNYLHRDFSMPSRRLFDPQAELARNLAGRTDQ